MRPPVAIPLADRDDVCEDLLLQAGPISEDDVTSRGEIETDELEGCEVVGRQENEEEEGPDEVATYAAILFHDDGTFLVAGLVDQATRDPWIERFREAARTLRRVRE